MRRVIKLPLLRLEISEEEFSLSLPGLTLRRLSPGQLDRDQRGKEL